ncbi:hypothetical protein AVEN_50911-1 [Araneus ventricosus]|uniref:Uncharacterized protein n=1 Tax=Araneus ventricosus TaxID=182803 RepID=A0A4Y2DWE5_ARAVE|nr:hypothetical protein AVEN_50911-1 [Araneus ventricosus]
MVSSSCMAIPILLAKLKNFCKSSSGKSEATLPHSPNFESNLDFKHLLRTRFSSNSDVKTDAENRLNGQGRDFYQAELSKLVLRSDYSLNGFGDYVEK